MNEIKFATFCEDTIQNIFIENLLFLINNEHHLNFLRHDHFYNKYPPGRNRNKVKNQFVDICKEVINNYYDIKILFIGYDMDDHSQDSFNEETKSFELIVKNEFEKYKNHFIIFIPVQCIEHWLWYIMDNKKRPGTLEIQPRLTAKKNIYANFKLRADKEKIVGELTKNFDYRRLQSRSFSFNYFFNKLKIIIDNIEK